MTDDQWDPFDLALPYLYGAKPDLRRFRALVELGAAAGDPLAQYALASSYLFGDKRLAIRRNQKEALRLLRLAARTFNRAMFELGGCYEHGVAVRASKRVALGWYERAANAGCVPAMLAFARLSDSARARRLARLASATIERVREARKA